MSLSTTNTNSSSITFYCPNNLKTNFDDLVKFKRISRTSIINLLMEKWIRSEYEMMKKDDQIQSLIRDVKVRHHINKPIKVNSTEQQPFDHWEPPMVPTLDDDYDWEERLGKL